MIRATTWTYVIDYNNGRSSMSGGALTMKSALAKAITDATYYAVGMGHPGVTLTLEEYCHRCRGTGILQKKRFKQVPCPDCKNNPLASKLGPIPFTIHQNCAQMMAQSA